MTPLKLRTAIYARVSTLDQDPAMQLRDMRARTRTILVTRSVSGMRPSADAVVIDSPR
jgi:DNA invertase Pin-like site-specific DNA recombinase